MRSITVPAVIIAACVVAGAAIAQEMPRLPAALELAQSGDSPGKVTFNHATHAGDRPDCTKCHPRLFSIAKRSTARPLPAEQKITHAKMEKGRQCGACHNGKVAFGFDDCTLCHR